MNLLFVYSTSIHINLIMWYLLIKVLFKGVTHICKLYEGYFSLIFFIKNVNLRKFYPKKYILFVFLKKERIDEMYFIKKEKEEELVTSKFVAHGLFHVQKEFFLFLKKK